MTQIPETTAAAGFTRYLGIEMERGAPGSGTSVATLKIEDHHCNPNGFLHGGVPYALADTGMAAATFSAIEPGQAAVTVSINIVYLAPAKEGILRCETTVVKKGNRLVTLESVITCGETFVAKALGTFTIIRGSSGPGSKA